MDERMQFIAKYGSPTRAQQILDAAWRNRAAEQLRSDLASYLTTIAPSDDEVADTIASIQATARKRAP